MTKLAFITLTVFRWLFLIIGLWQIIGIWLMWNLLSVQSEPVKPGVLFSIGLKFLILFVGVLAFWLLGKFVKRLSKGDPENAEVVVKE